MFSIRWKLILSILLPLLLIASIVMGLTLQRLYDSAAQTLQEQYLNEVSLLARSIDNELQSYARIADDTTSFLHIMPPLRKEEIYALLSQNAGNNAMIYGAALAFEPFAFDKKQRLFSPYVFDTDLKAIDISAVAYDYTDGNWAWYSAVKDSQQAQWSEPYFDTGAGNMAMTTYSSPLYYGDTFTGVATIDLRLDALSMKISRALGNQKFMLLSQKGRYVSYYNPEQTLHSGLDELAAGQTNPEFMPLQEHLRNRLSGMAVINNMMLDGSPLPGNTWVFYTPVPSTGWELVTLLSETDLTRSIRDQISITLLGLSLTILLIFVLVWVISTRMTRPIKMLEAAVSDVARGKLDTHIENIRSRDELGRLSIGFNRMLKNLKKQIDIQSQQEAAQKLLEREWQMARETQRSLLPTEFPAFPDRKEFELHGVNQAANHVAGDFFDFFLINPKTLFFVIADVSGKGMSAALVMAVTRTIVRNLAQSGKSPADILRETNERLRDSQKGVAFVTIFLGSYNTGTGRIIYANGGHPPPYLLGKTGTVISVGDATGTIVGMLENQEYRNAELRLQPGETLLLYTDGLPEARSPGGEFFSSGRIRSFLQHNPNTSANILCENIVREALQFQNQNLADDITVLALKRTMGSLGSFFLKI